jgi:hypothetical protein
MYLRQVWRDPRLSFPQLNPKTKQVSYIYMHAVFVFSAFQSHYALLIRLQSTTSKGIPPHRTNRTYNKYSFQIARCFRQTVGMALAVSIAASERTSLERFWRMLSDGRSLSQNRTGPGVSMYLRRDSGLSLKIRLLVQATSTQNPAPSFHQRPGSASNS